ncbi:hypothetical protein DK68_3096 [Brucella suis]|nr:hypothetical protein C066_00623 [Brucella sp. UK5/01]ENT10624.1 hypothetical protein C983_00661 [Brucella sp. F23/97]ENT17308.1 hypothetical protein B998_01009 [Brucella sp. F96/2]ENT23669.1 hypothetical protein C051_00727 [Brucella sp. UK40/99]KFJ29279.1 hypothetical protein DK68_3096 [Brucella suis]SPU60335.1 Uncharacterised protein [Brucella melitensis]GFP63264.1 hypothetical protein BCBD1442_26220 [Brucella ceti]
MPQQVLSLIQMQKESSPGEEMLTHHRPDYHLCASGKHWIASRLQCCLSDKLQGGRRWHLKTYNVGTCAPVIMYYQAGCMTKQSRNCTSLSAT